MSAPAAPTDSAAPAKKGSKKKLIIILGVLLLVLLLGGGGAFFLLKKKAAQADEGEDGAPAAAAAEHAKDEHRTPPVFVPVEPFVANLTDRDRERYIQVGLSLEVADAKAADEIKAYMPAIRNGILMVLSHKSSEDLLQPEGKEQLNDELLRESIRSIGLTVKPPSPDGKVSGLPKNSPIKRVHFSSFIIQ